MKNSEFAAKNNSASEEEPIRKVPVQAFLNNRVTIFRRFLVFGFVAALFVGSSFISIYAGALLTKTNQAQVGTLVESEAAVSLQSQYGAVEYKKDQLLWYSTSPEITTVFKAGQKALSDNNPTAARALFGISASKEPDTAIQAKEQIESLKTAVSTTLPSAVYPSGPIVSVNDALSPEEKIARGKQMIANGKDMLTQEHLDTTHAAAIKATANQNIADGQKLMAQGEKELAELNAKKAAEQDALLAKQQEMQKANQVVAAVQNVSEWTPEEKKVNGGAALAFALMVLGSLWRITMKEPAKGS